MTTCRLWILAALALWIGGTAMAQDRVWPVPFRVLPEVSVPDGYHVFQTRDAWKGSDTSRPRPSINGVDWAAEMVISASMGQRPTAGYRVEIVSVARVGREVMILVQESAPEPGAMTAQVITRPSTAIALRKLEGPFVFVVNGRRMPPGAPVVPVAPVAQPGARVPEGLATSLFIARRVGGPERLSTQTVLHLVGRPLKPAEVPTGTRETLNAQVLGPNVRMLEQIVRESGFMALNPSPVPDGQRPPDALARTITARMDGRDHSVTVVEGRPVPAAFEKVWEAIQTTLGSRGVTTRLWEPPSS